MFEVGRLRINLDAGKFVIESFDHAAEVGLNLRFVAAIIEVRAKPSP
jgi:hypothetical protein